MRKLLLLLILLIFIVGCSDDDKTDDSKLVESETTYIDPEKEKFSAHSELWTHSLDVDITHNFEGLDIHFKEIKLGKANNKNYLGFKVNYKNLSHNSFTFYPALMEIKLDNGEEISSYDEVARFEKGTNEMTEKGETFEGFYVFEAITPILEINEIYVSWNNYKLDYDDEVDDYFKFEVELTIEN